MAAQPPRKSQPAKKTKPKSSPGLMTWLGRQVGHVKKAVKTDVTKPAAGAKKVSEQSGKPSPPAPSRVVYRDDKVEEIDHPTQPGLKLRRTIIDEVIVDPNAPRNRDST
jgi:hypothetical protein